MVWLNGQSCTVAASLFRFTHTASLVKVVVCLLPLDFRGGGGGRRISQSDRSKSPRNRHSAVLLLRHIDGSVVEWDAQTEKGVFWLVKKKHLFVCASQPFGYAQGGCAQSFPSFSTGGSQEREGALGRFGSGSGPCVGLVLTRSLAQSLFVWQHGLPLFYSFQRKGIDDSINYASEFGAQKTRGRTTELDDDDIGHEIVNLKGTIDSGITNGKLFWTSPGTDKG